MIAPRLDLPPIGPSMICAGCDGEMVITHDAIGRERVRCPVCQGVSRVRPHPDDVMLPQGLVKATNVPPRIVQQVVHVRVPVPAPAKVVAEFPPLGAGQLRCQLCARGIHPAYRFCDRCGVRGAQVLQAADVGRQSKPRAPKAEPVYKKKQCKWTEAGVRCDREFQPTGARSDYCDAHQHAAYLKSQAEANARRARQYAEAKRRST